MYGGDGLNAAPELPQKPHGLLVDPTGQQHFGTALLFALYGAAAMAGSHRRDCLRQHFGVFLLQAEEFSPSFLHVGFESLKVARRSRLRHEQQA
jgi:hypothetical protein